MPPSLLQSFRQLAPYLRSQRKLLVLAALCMSASAALSIAIPMLGAAIMKGASSPTEDGDGRVALNVMLTVFAVGSHHFVSFCGHYLVYVASQRVCATMLGDAVCALCDIDYPEASVRIPPAERTALLSRAMNAIDNAITGTLTNIFSSVITGLGVLYMVLHISWQLTVLFVVVVSLTQLFSKWYSRNHAVNGSEAVAAEARMFSLVNLVAQRGATLRIFAEGAQPFVKGAFASAAAATVEKKAAVNWGVHGNAGFTSGITNALFVVLLGLTSHFASVGLITVFDIAPFFFFVAQLRDKILTIVSESKQVATVAAQSEHFFELIAEQQRVKSRVRAAHGLPFEKAPIALAGSVELTNITARYTAGSAAVLRNVSLKVAPGTLLAVVGASGAGKSSLLRVICGLLDFGAEGEVHIDGVNVTISDSHRRVKVSSPGSRIALLEQTPALLPGSLLDNIRIARPGASDDEVLDAARRAHCDEFVSNSATLPLGYASQITSTDVAQLSGGQQQRICLARVLLSDARVVCFDEPTTGLCATSAEAFLRDGLQHLRREGRTVICVTHALGMLRYFDEVVVISDGQIARRCSAKDFDASATADA